MKQVFIRQTAFSGIWLLAITLLFSVISLVSAQDTDQDTEEPWTEPVNLSLSGTATEPRLVLEANGSALVIWKDFASDTFVFSRGEGNEWSEPVAAEPPFGTRRFFVDLDAEVETPLFVPRLVVDGDDRVHAFWIDDEAELRYSSVLAPELADFTAWGTRQSLAGSVETIAADIDGDGRLHLIYLGFGDGDSTPAGIYYRRSDNSGGAWSDPILLYSSPYLRAVPSEQANLQMAISGSGDAASLFVVWDIRALDSVFVARSVDGGQSWDDPTTIDQRQAEDEPEATGPSNVMVHAMENHVHLSWQAGHELSECDQYHQLSTDGGDTWLPRQKVLTESSGCPEQYWLMGNSGEPMLMLTNLQGQSALLAWNGEEWSEPQPQETLAAFTSPTTHRPINFDCLQSLLLEGSKLLVVGCGSGLAKDIWVTSRPIGDVEAWFPPEPIWSPPTTVAGESSQLQIPATVVDADGRLHAFWSQLESEAGVNEDTAIHYAVAVDERWTRPFPLLRSPSGGAGSPAVALGADDQLLAVWSGWPGEIYFSQAGIEQAFVSANWSTPVTLPLPRQGAAGPAIVVDRAGVIYVAYAIPLNEMRGVYLTKSTDNGRSWADPVQVFDGAAAGWEMVGRPQMALSPEGELHLIWSRQTLRGSAEGQAQALYYARSDDGGATFNEAESVVEGLLSWTKILATAEGVTHRLWQDETGGAAFVHHERSLDGGRTWGTEIVVTNAAGPAAVTADGGGRLHFVQASDTSLAYRLWDGDSWQSEEGQEGLDEAATSGTEALAAVIAPERRLSVLFAGPAAEMEGDETQYALFYSGRPVELPAAIPTPLPTATPTPLPTPTATATPTPTSTPTPDFSDIPEQGGALPLGFIDTSNNVIGTIVGLLPAALLILLVIGVATLMLRRIRG